MESFPSNLTQSGTLHMQVHERLVYFNSCGGVRVGLCVSGLFVYVGLRLNKSGLMQRLFHDLRISHNAPWAHQIPGICPITLWPWLAVRHTNEFGHIMRWSLSAINDNKLHNTHLDQWYSGQSIWQQLTRLIRGNMGNFPSPPHQWDSQRPYC